MRSFSDPARRYQVRLAPAESVASLSTCAMVFSGRYGLDLGDKLNDDIMPGYRSERLQLALALFLVAVVGVIRLNLNGLRAEKSFGLSCGYNATRI